ncbi:hypothetical protein [Paraburkholderia tropica]|uniref:hypothetical protein n=1 Tax=Paraburkholderia tropica TaxID=92647 RepID=UPI001F240F92|nr:hypothetical protein [Paraburkholderia tropica]
MHSNVFHQNDDAATSHLHAISIGTEGADTATGTPEAAPKSRKRRFTKLTASELTGLPGATVAGGKPAGRDMPSIQFKVPVSAVVGTVDESAEIFNFACTLDEQSQAQRIGTVSNIAIGDGSAEVVLKLDAAVDPNNHGSAAADAFARLSEVLSAARVLQDIRAGRRATWRAKINGTTIAEGSY